MGKAKHSTRFAFFHISKLRVIYTALNWLLGSLKYANNVIYRAVSPL